VVQSNIMESTSTLPATTSAVHLPEAMAPQGVEV